MKKRKEEHMQMSSKGALLAFVPLIAISLALGIYLNASVAPYNQSPTTNLTNYISYETSAETSNSTLGLRLELSINSTPISSGQFISATVAEYNILPGINNVSATRDWRLHYLALGPCGTLNYPFGIAFIQGYYTTSNISSATPLSLEKQGAIYNCPMIAVVQYYLLQPMSDNGSIYAQSENGTAGQCCFAIPGQPSPMNGTLSAGTYWDSSNVEHNFGPGVYTVAGGDEWGQLVLLHFEVS